MSFASHVCFWYMRTFVGWNLIFIWPGLVLTNFFFSPLVSGFPIIIKKIWIQRFFKTSFIFSTVVLIFNNVLVYDSCIHQTNLLYTHCIRHHILVNKTDKNVCNHWMSLVQLDIPLLYSIWFAMLLLIISALD